MVFYRTVKVDGLSIFYRESGRSEAPTLVLLAWLSLILPDVRTAADASLRALPPRCP
jgi:hypothetical protein